MKKARAFLFACFSIAILVSVLAWVPVPPTSAQVGFCDENIAISLSSGTTQTIVVAVAGETVRVCALSISGDTLATTAQFKSGSTNLTGAMRMCDECNISMGDGSAIIMQAPADGNLTITSATGAVTGWIRLGQN